MEFYWTYPCYLLVETKTVYLGLDGFQFITPEMFGPDSERGVALFTDIDLAERYRDQITDRSVKVMPVPLDTPEDFLRFLQRALGRYRFLVVDMNYQLQNPQVLPIDVEIRRLIGDQGNHDSP